MAQKIKRDYITYKDLDKIIDKYEPQYIMLISGRNDGKSYAVKERALRRYLSDKEQFTYLRRFEIDHKRSDPALYWADFFKKDSNKVAELTDGLWDRISAEGKQYFYLARKEGKNIVKGDAIGYIHALSVQSSYKSLQFPDVTNIIFEEMVSDRFLYNEPRILMNYVSTVLRSDIGRVWMIGNTITRINPYFREFQLTGFSKMKPGQVDVYDHTYTNDDGTESTTRIVVHIPNITNKGASVKGMFFGSSAGMISGQHWDSREMPHLQDKIGMYETMYEIIFDYDINATYYMRLLQHRQHPERVLWYVEPKTTELKPGIRVISPRLREDYGPYYTNKFMAIHPKEAAAFRLLDMGRIAYSDNLTGTEFQRALKMSRTVDNTRE